MEVKEPERKKRIKPCCNVTLTQAQIEWGKRQPGGLSAFIRAQIEAAQSARS